MTKSKSDDKPKEQDYAVKPHLAHARFSERPRRLPMDKTNSIHGS